MALTDNLQAYWKLDEASGTRVDETANNNDLADNNTVTSAAGKIGDAGLFVRANNESLSIADASQTGLDITGDMSVQMWLYFVSTPGSGNFFTLFEKMAASNYSYMCIYNNNGGTLQWRFQNSSNGSTLSSQALYNNTVSTSTWYHVVVTYTASSGTVDFWINGSQNTAGTTVATSTYNGTAPFTLGDGGVFNENFDGRMDEVGVWSRVLSSTEIGNLYNSGSGLAYADFGGAAAPANLKSYNTNLAANIKSINTNLIANVKSLDTNV